MSRKIRYQWSENEISFLRIYYPDNGLQYCSEKLNISKDVVVSRIQKLGLKVSSLRKLEVQKTNSLKYLYPNEKLFIDLNRKDVAYIMGILWSDGYLNRITLSLEINKNDINNIKNVFFGLGEWDYKENIKRKNRKILSSISCHLGSILSIFENYGYTQKSKNSPNFIEKLNGELMNYFLRGVIDGDGCFYINKKTNQTQFSLAGSYNQNWNYFTDILNSLNIKYNIKKSKIKKEGKIHKSSVVRITKRNDIVKLGDFVYVNYEMDKMGLKRKYDKYIITKNLLKKFC
jgi:hypothetical protein